MNTRCPAEEDRKGEGEPEAVANEVIFNRDTIPVVRKI
jgi:hypothetical protein